MTVRAVNEDSKAGNKDIVFEAVVRLNSPVELEYLQHGGILPRVLRMFLNAG